jgi:hypothetical protein
MSEETIKESEQSIEDHLEIDLLNKLDNLYLTIDTLEYNELEKVIKYAEEQKSISKLAEKRKKDLSNQLRIERIKMRRELIEQKKKNKKEESSEEESEEEKPKKKIIKKNRK